MNLSRSNIAFLCFAWVVFLLLGISFGFTAAFVLALIGTILYLVG